MRLKFLANRHQEYQGVDGKGGMLSLKKGDECEVSDSVGAKLKQHYFADFEEIKDQEKEFEADSNKMLSKGAKFKSK